MEVSRIFIRGLPPSLSETDFKKHFGQQGTITDSRLFSDRRIGYVGYKTPDEANRAVKYFNRTFIKMSKIAVELARPVEESVPFKRQGYGKQGAFERPIADQQHNLKRKRESQVDNKPDSEVDPKLQEYLEVMQPRSKSKRTDDFQLAGTSDTLPKTGEPVVEDEGDASDGEYQSLQTKKNPSKESRRVANPPQPAASVAQTQEGAEDKSSDEPTIPLNDNEATAVPTSDADWLRSKTSRLLGLNDDEADEQGNGDNTDEDDGISEAQNVHSQRIAQDQEESRAQQPEEQEEETPSVDEIEQKIQASARLYLRNLSYAVTEDDLRKRFTEFGDLQEVHVPIDVKTGLPKGFAYVHFSNADDAVNAWKQADGKTFQGRLLHILPATAKRETLLDDFALSKLPLKKQQQIKRKREASSSTFNWNALYMNADAVMSSVADRLGVSKAELLDPTSSDAAIKQAHAETHVIQETKAYFKKHGIDLDAFKRRERGDTTILVKNFAYDAKTSELKALFEEHGKVKSFLMPPTGTIAIVEFEQAPQARAAFSALAYRKIGSSVLFLEKAPKDLFTGDRTAPKGEDSVEAVAGRAAAPSTADLLQEDTSNSTAATSTLFVRNLNFTTTTDRLMETFRPLDGFISARVKTKTDPKKPGQVLSMGFGFVEFKTKAQAQAALSAINGQSLEGHKLEVRASHKATDAGEERRQEDKAKKLAGRRTKIIIKNLPFQTSKHDVRALFGEYGQLRSIRVPKKFDKSARGFAFAEFTTPKEAQSAMDALRDTHLLGRRLVLDFAEEEPEDAEAEIEKMQKKVGSQINKVALQKLTGNGRKKFNIRDPEGDEA